MASLAVPRDATVGATARLKLEARVPKGKLLRNGVSTLALAEESKPIFSASVLQVSLPPSSLCASAATLAALPLPSGDDLGLVVARKLETWMHRKSVSNDTNRRPLPGPLCSLCQELRWPGHPEKPRFAIFKNLPGPHQHHLPICFDSERSRTIVLEAGFGTGRARLEVSGQEILEASPCM